jgi:hypothetical protein
MSRVGSALALLIGAAALPGCGASTNLTKLADDLQTALMSMPGVTDAWVDHDDSHAEGVTFNIAVDVPDATHDQMVDIADRIAAIRISPVTNYTQNVEFRVMPDKPVTISRQSHVDAGQIADDTDRLRVIAAGADGRVDWFRSDDNAVNELSFNQSHTPGADLLDVVRRTAGNTGVTMSVSPSAPSRQTPRMITSFPLSAQGEKSIRQFLEAVPVDVFGVRIDTGGVRALQAMVPADTAVAERQLAAVIDASKAVTDRPMWLAWYVPTAVGGVPVFGGVVEVGGCSAPAAQIRQAAQRLNHEDAAPLQTHLQSRADTCAGPDAIHSASTQSPPESISSSPTSVSGRPTAPDSAPAPDVTSAAVRPAPVSTGNPTSGGGTSVTVPVRLPSPGRQSTPSISLPAAAQDPTGPPPHSPAPSHRPTGRTVRSGR